MAAVGGIGYGVYYAYDNQEDGGEATLARSGMLVVDGAVLAKSWKGNPSGIVTKSLIRGGGAPLVGLTSAVEIGIELSNKDGDAASAATIIGTTTATGAALGTMIPIPVVGTVVGAVGGAVTGVVIVSYTNAEDGLGRFYNDMIYHGSWFNQGMIEETKDVIQQAIEYKERLDQGDVSQAELAKHNDLIQDMEDHIMDLQKAEAGLIHNLTTWQSLDSNNDGVLTKEEASKDETALQDYEFLETNRELQAVLTATRTVLTESYDEQRHGQLDALLDGAESASDIEARLRGDFSHVARSLKSTFQASEWTWWNNQDDWREDLNEIRSKVTDSTSGAFNLSSLDAEDLNELQRKLHNTRDEVEDRIQNLLYKASKGDLDKDEFEELKLLREDLRSVDQLEDVLWPSVEIAEDNSSMPELMQANARDITEPNESLLTAEATIQGPGLNS